MASPSGVPVPTQTMIDANGQPTQAWRQFFVTLWNRTGGGAGGGVTASITTGSSATGLPQARSDQDASVNHGVPRWGFYMNGSVLQVQKDYP